MAAPAVLSEDLAAFHAAHFSVGSTSHFTEQFLGPEKEGYPEDIEDDGLGYYEDGTKRTLTDDQIAIFRHSEIQALLRDRRHAAEAKQDEEDNHIQGGSQEWQIEDKNSVQRAAVVDQGQEEHLLEDGELDEEVETPITDLASSPPAIENEQHKKKKKKKKQGKEKKTQEGKQKGFFKQHIKPDLRKRTWDNLDTGLGSLDYDEGDSTAASTRPMQRRRISYDDD